MIQRIQSIFYALAAAGALFNGFLPGIKRADLSGFGFEMGNYGVMYTLFTYGSLATGALLILTIFSFSKRPRQLKLGNTSMLIGLATTVCWGLLYYKMSSYKMAGLINELNGAIAFLLVVLILLGNRGVKNDEQLVKSLDRIR